MCKLFHLALAVGWRKASVVDLGVLGRDQRLDLLLLDGDRYLDAGCLGFSCLMEFGVWSYSGRIGM